MLTKYVVHPLIIGMALVPVLSAQSVSGAVMKLDIFEEVKYLDFDNTGQLITVNRVYETFGVAVDDTIRTPDNANVLDVAELTYTDDVGGTAGLVVAGAFVDIQGDLITFSPMKQRFAITSLEVILSNIELSDPTMRIARLDMITDDLFFSTNVSFVGGVPDPTSGDITFSYTSNNSSSITTAASSSDYNTFRIITEPIPEPSSSMLLVLGAAGLIMRRRR
ncbi:MAG: PEP-CTERM sorting domain-containing protein [Akkermansiaceae bacterium]